MFLALKVAKHRERVTKLAALATFHGEYSRPFECPYSKIILA